MSPSLTGGLQHRQSVFSIGLPMEISGRLKLIVMQVELGLISAMERKLIGVHRAVDQSTKACLSKFFDNKRLKRIVHPIQLVFSSDLPPDGLKTHALLPSLQPASPIFN
jgi:hypothetical protein